MSVTIKPVTGSLALTEGPHWDVEQQTLYFISILPSAINKYVPATGKHTSTSIDFGNVAFIIPVEGVRDQFVCGVDRQVVIVEWDGNDGTTAKLVEVVGDVAQDQPTTRLNDGKVDSRGRLYTGTLGEQLSPGEFARYKGYHYRVDRGQITKLGDRISLSNGMAWDDARKVYYYIDSLENNIRRYDYDVKTGDLSNMSYIFDFKAKEIDGIPDGATVDTDGNLWVAVFYASCVLKINPATGEILKKITMPVDQVTSVAFGGKNLDELFVTTGALNFTKEQLPPAGAVFRVTGVGAKGSPAYKYKI